MLRRSIQSLHSRSLLYSKSTLRSFASNGYNDIHGTRFSMTKIVGTIGPVSENREMIQKAIDEGLRIMRINFSHATYEEALLRMTNLRASCGLHHTLSTKASQPFNLRAVLLDTKGPEIRTGEMKDGKKIRLETGNEILLTVDPAYEDIGTAEKIYISYEKLPQTVAKGDTVLLCDGLIRLTVLQVCDNGDIRCVIENTELLGNRKGVNLPGLSVDLPALSDLDKEHLAFGLKHDIDFIAASFIRKKSDILEIRDYVNSIFTGTIPPKIIAKIENLEGIQNFMEILQAADGIMVARGDLGVEVPLEKVLTYQKYIVQECNKVGKPVIVATQMLESMMQNPRPTRAEVSDVGNAVADGADCVMLSGEVALGKYPIETIATMRTIIKEAENPENQITRLEEYKKLNIIQARSESSLTPEEIELESVAQAAVDLAKDLAQLLIVLTDSGDTARAIAKCKPTVPVMCFTTDTKVGRQLQIHRGLYPIVPRMMDVTKDDYTRPTVTEAVAHAKQLGWLKSGDRCVVVSADLTKEQIVNANKNDTLSRQILLRVADVA